MADFINKDTSLIEAFVNWELHSLHPISGIKTDLRIHTNSRDFVFNAKRLKQVLDVLKMPENENIRDFLNRNKSIILDK